MMTPQGIALVNNASDQRRGHGRSRPRWMLVSWAGLLLAMAGGLLTTQVQAQTGGGGAIILKSDVQEANALTGVITARGNVQVEYPSRDIYATSAQAQYFSQERRIILSGDVVVLQDGNRLEAETVTYLVDEGRFVALPQPDEQVRATYIVPASEDPATSEADSAEATGSPPTPTAEASSSPVLTVPATPAPQLELDPMETSDPLPETPSAPR